MVLDPPYCIFINMSKLPTLDLYVFKIVREFLSFIYIFMLIKQNIQLQNYISLYSKGLLIDIVEMSYLNSILMN